ncbi:hypothetical protein F2Q70_00025268 [Brassica cretica]|uniref:Replication factor A C-terminal domain-containing protein n=1 Tax=Brassica cretica TaxID=69181 RepID=A0A8S9L7C8_BRACR|nr:hypothetical protein F2Q70_00025268 [Brassica cretica]
MAMKRNGKSPVSSDSDEKVMFFKDVSLGFILILISCGTVIQGFIPPGRIKKYLPDMKRGSVYKLINFYGSKNKPVYWVADHVATVSFAWNSEMSVLREIPISFDEDRFRFHSYEDFEANCDLKGDLYAVIDVVGHMKLVDGQTLIERPNLDHAKIATTRHIMVHVQSHEGPVMKLYLWDQAATDFCEKFNSCENTLTVLLVTTVNTKRTLAMTSMSSTRVFMDYDVQPTRDYFTWLGSNPEIANQVSADVITKRETLSIAEIFSYMTQESAKGTVIQGFIPPGRIKKYLPEMKRGSVYKLINFYGSKKQTGVSGC